MNHEQEPRHILAPHVLTIGEAMTVRVAYGCAGLRCPDAITTKDEAMLLHLVLFRFRARMESEGLGDDYHGRAMSRKYATNCQTVMFVLQDMADG